MNLMTDVTVRSNLMIMTFQIPLLAGHLKNAPRKQYIITRAL